MITSGCIRHFDDIGRIQIPREVRRMAFGANDDVGLKAMEVFYEKDGTIILKPYDKIDEEELWS